jgi:hypothetical protein
MLHTKHVVSSCGGGKGDHRAAPVCIEDETINTAEIAQIQAQQRISSAHRQLLDRETKQVLLHPTKQCD